MREYIRRIREFSRMLSCPGSGTTRVRVYVYVPVSEFLLYYV